MYIFDQIKNSSINLKGIEQFNTLNKLKRKLYYRWIPVRVDWQPPPPDEYMGKDICRREMFPAGNHLVTVKVQLC